jgi:hypothetical protein
MNETKPLAICMHKDYYGNFMGEMQFVGLFMG